MELGDPDAHLHRQQGSSAKGSGDGRNRLGPSGHCDGDVGVADNGAIGWIEALPASSRQKNLHPGMHAAGLLGWQCGEAVTADETGGETESPGRLHEQKRDVTAGSPAAEESFGGGLDARLIASAVGDPLVGRQIQAFQQRITLDDFARLPDRCHPLPQWQARFCRRHLEIGLQQGEVLGSIVKGIGNSVIIHKKVQWHSVVLLNDQAAFDQQPVSGIAERGHGKTIALNITVPAQVRRRENG